MGLLGALKDFAFDSSTVGATSVLGPFAPIVGPMISDKIQERPFDSPAMAVPTLAPLVGAAAVSNLVEHGSINAPAKKESPNENTGLGHLSPMQFSQIDSGPAYDPSENLDDFATDY